jgi:hypothetical protein
VVLLGWRLGIRHHSFLKYVFICQSLSLGCKSAEVGNVWPNSHKTQGLVVVGGDCHSTKCISSKTQRKDGASLGMGGSGRLGGTSVGPKDYESQMGIQTLGWAWDSTFVNSQECGSGGRSGRDHTRKALAYPVRSGGPRILKWRLFENFSCCVFGSVKCAWDATRVQCLCLGIGWGQPKCTWGQVVLWAQTFLIFHSAQPGIRM